MAESFADFIEFTQFVALVEKVEVLKRNKSLVVGVVSNVVVGKEHRPLVSTESIGDVERIEEIIQFPLVIVIYVGRWDVS